jgi:arylsulfatase A
MKINRVSKCVVACLCLFVASCATGRTVQDRPPNIVFIFIDDMGYGDIGPFGSTQNKTPHLDRMAEEGIKLTSFYVSSTACTPSRSALMTGCYADRIGMDGSVNFPIGERGLNPDEITIAELLKTRGYATGCFGKWHMGDQPGFMPLDNGFDEYVGIPYSNDMWPGNGKKQYLPLPIIKGNTPVAHIPDGKSQALLCDVVTDATVDFIKRHKDEPFFAYVPHAHIHFPRFTETDNAETADGNVTRAQIEEVDGSVGLILETLEKLGIAENTLVIFTSDNGGSGGTSMGPLRGGKGGPKYEGHMRVPTVAWWPGQIPAGSETDEIAATIDMLPTFAKLAGAEVPKYRVIDGKDVLPLILGTPGAKSPHDVHFYEIEGVRRGKWKLVVTPKNKLELYDLDTDLGETTDLALKFPERVAELKSLIDAHAEDLQNNRRPAAFVENPKPLLTSGDGVPTLAEYMGRGGIEVVEATKPTRK